MIRESLLGALSGLAATAPMTGAMKLGHRRLAWRERYALPPRQITMRVARTVGVQKHLDQEQRTGATLAAHYGYGATMGAVYGATLGTAAEDSPASTIGKGAAFGMGVWAGSYLGLLPALGLHESATEHPWRRNLLMIGAHVVWGMSLASLFKALHRTVPAREMESSQRGRTARARQSGRSRRVH